jgi:hypothetical protein
MTPAKEIIKANTLVNQSAETLMNTQAKQEVELTLSKCEKQFSPSR